MRCKSCKRPLSDPVSIKHGYGPECIKRAVRSGLVPVSAIAELRAYRSKTTPDEFTGDLFEREKDE